MDLSGLIKKHQRLLSVLSSTSEGEYINGKWIKPETLSKSFYGAKLNLTSSEVKIYGDGAYTVEDIKVFVPDDLLDTSLEALVLLEEEILVIDGTKYKISKILDASELAGFRKIIATKVVIDD